MGLEHVYLVFYCLLTGIIMALVFLICELIVYGVCRKKKQHQSQKQQQWAIRNPQATYPHRKVPKLGWGEMDTYEDHYDRDVNYREDLMEQKFKGLGLPYLN